MKNSPRLPPPATNLLAATGRAPRREGSVTSHLRNSLNRTHSKETHSDMVSLEGQAENVLIPCDDDRHSRVGSALSMHDQDDPFEEHHLDDIVEHLDVVDPQIATVSMLTNCANSIVIPPLSFYSRKPVVVLAPANRPRRSSITVDAEKGRARTPEHDDYLDQHVEEVLRKRDKFKRVMQGVWSFMKTPIGIIVSIYAFLVIIWGSGIVLFLARIINLHNKNLNDFWVEVCQQIETSLFSFTSIGLIPFRVMDTWRVYWIWHYQQKTMKLRKKAGLPDLYDENDLPDEALDPNYVHVLTPKEQADLHYQQHKFALSMTWYRPHGTATHRAFPIHVALWICLMNDLNSFFQCLLSGCMWSMNRFQRPAWTTATTLPLAFVAGIVAAVLIWWGGKKTKRNEEVEKRLRMALAMETPSTPESANTTESQGECTAAQRAIVECKEKDLQAAQEKKELKKEEKGLKKDERKRRRHDSKPGSDPKSKDFADSPTTAVSSTSSSPAPSSKTSSSPKRSSPTRVAPPTLEPSQHNRNNSTTSDERASSIPMTTMRNGRPHRSRPYMETIESTPSIPIADRMTVPPAIKIDEAEETERYYSADERQH